MRCFEDNDIVHVNGRVDPKSDIDVINLELVFSDLDQVCLTELVDGVLLTCLCISHALLSLRSSLITFSISYLI